MIPFTGCCYLFSYNSKQLIFTCFIYQHFSLTTWCIYEVGSFLNDQPSDGYQISYLSGVYFASLVTVSVSTTVFIKYSLYALHV